MEIEDDKLKLIARAALDSIASKEYGTLTSGPATEWSYYGVYFSEGGKDAFWRICCPCGVEKIYPINGLPETTTLHPCGKPNHWTVFYK